MEVVRKLDLNDLEQMVNLRIAIQNHDLKYIIEHLDKNLFMFGLFINIVEGIINSESGKL